MPNSEVRDVLALGLDSASGRLYAIKGVHSLGHRVLGVPLGGPSKWVGVVHAVSVAGLGEGAGVELVIAVPWVIHAKSSLEKIEVDISNKLTIRSFQLCGTNSKPTDKSL